MLRRTEGGEGRARDHVMYLFALTKKQQRETRRNKKKKDDALMNCDTYWRNTLSQYIDVYIYMYITKEKEKRDELSP